MAESGLSVGFTELQQAVGFLLGYGRTIASWSATQVVEIGLAVQSGVRRVYYPIGVAPGYEWSWLRPSAMLYLGASGTDGTVTGTSFDSDTFTDWTTQGIAAGDTVDITAVTSGSTTVAEYTVASVTAGAVTLTEAPGNGTGITFNITRDPSNYNLPDDLGRIIGNLHYATDENQAPVVIVSLDDILKMRSRSDRTSAPVYAAVRPRAEARAAGQRWEILFFPRTTTYYPLTYSYEAYSGTLTDALPYPLGGMELAELYIESCLAVAEQRVNEEAGLHTQAYQALLVDAIARDRKRGPRLYGQMGDRELETVEFRRGRELYNGTYSITYDGNYL